MRPSTSKNPGVSNNAKSWVAPSSVDNSALRTSYTCVVPTSSAPMAESAWAMAFTSEDLPTPVLPSTSTLSSSRARSHARSSGVSADRSTANGPEALGKERGADSAVSSRLARIEERRARLGAHGRLGGCRDDATSADDATATRPLAAANIDILLEPRAARARVSSGGEEATDSGSL